MSEEKIELNFKELSSFCDRRAPTGSWFDYDDCPPWEHTCVGHNIDTETPSIPEPGREQECKVDNCPIWKRFRTVMTGDNAK